MRKIIFSNAQGDVTIDVHFDERVTTDKNTGIAFELGETDDIGVILFSLTAP